MVARRPPKKNSRKSRLFFQSVPGTQEQFFKSF
jgi:hypothetical protein